MKSSLFCRYAAGYLFDAPYQRDVNERGRSMDSVMAQYQKTVRPMFLQFIELPNNMRILSCRAAVKNRIAIDILKAKISQFLNKSGELCTVQ